MQHEALVSGRVLTAFVMLAIFLVMSLVALGFPAQARLMPLMVGVPGSVLALVQVVLELRAATDERAALRELPVEARQRELHMFAWLLLFFFGVLGFGFVHGAPLLVLGFLRFGRKETLATGVMGAAGTWIVLFGLFEAVFEIPLFRGHVIEWLAG